MWRVGGGKGFSLDEVLSGVRTGWPLFLAQFCLPFWIFTSEHILDFCFDFDSIYIAIGAWEQRCVKKY